MVHGGEHVRGGGSKRGWKSGEAMADQEGENSDMRWLKRIGLALVGMIAAAVLVLSILASRQEAREMSVSVEINRPPEEVWKWIEEPGKIRQWVSWLVEIKELTPGVRGKGARGVWVMEDRNNNNALMNLNYEVAAYDPGKSRTVKITAVEGFEGEVEYKLADMGNGRTRLEMQSQYTFHTWFVKLLSPLILPQARKKAEDDFARLKQKAEAGG